MLLHLKKDYHPSHVKTIEHSKEIALVPVYLFQSAFPVSKFYQAFTILSNIASQHLLRLIEDQKLYIFGQWMTPVLKVPDIDYNISNISALCLSICRLAELDLQISLSELTLQQILKMMTGHRIIWFRNKSTT